jgi:CubicO group peptidase (beta-lactamase class C family)
MTEAWAVVEDGVAIAGRDAELLVPWWSFTKTVLATAALVLARDGAVALDVPLPGQPYALRQLLQHRSGLGDYGGLAAYHEAVDRGEDPWPASTLLDRTEADRLRYRTGEGWDYSNIGYLFVRQLIENLTGANLDAALRRLVLGPLGIDSARIAQDRADLDHVSMGDAQIYHPGWVYHGLMVGTVADAAILLDRLMAGNLLSLECLDEMARPFFLPGPLTGRPWSVPGYGLGLMCGETSLGGHVAGHTGAGPGSTVAVYYAGSAKPSRTAAFPSRTGAFFATGEDQAHVESQTFRLIYG